MKEAWKRLGKKRGSFFLKLLCSYLVLIFTIIIAVFLATIRLYTRQIEEQYAQAYEKMLLQADYTIQEIYVQAYKFGLQMMEEKYVSMGIFNEDIQDREYYNVLTSITAAIEGTTHVHSVYLYNQKAGRFINSNKKRYDVLQGEPDIMDIIRKAHDNPGGGFYPHIARYQILKQEYEENLLSLVILPYGISSESSVIVNISDMVFKDLFASMDNEQKSRFYVIDKEGLLVSSSVDYHFMRDVSGEAFFQKMADCSQKVGHFVERVKGRRELFSYIYNPSMEVWLVSILDYEVILSEIWQVLRLSLFLLVAVCAASMLLAYLLGRQIFEPIQQVSDKMGYRRNDREKNTDEIHYIDARFGTMQQKISSMELEAEEHLKREWQHYLKKLLIGETVYGNEEQARYFERGRQREEQSAYQLLCVKIGKFDIKKVKTDQQLRRVKARLLEASEEYLQPSCWIETADMGINMIALLIGTNQAIERVAIQKLVRNVKEEMGISIKVSVSPLCGEWERITDVYRMAEEAMDYEFVYGREEILDWEQIIGSRETDEASIGKMRDELLRKVKAGNGEEVQQMVRAYFDWLGRYSYRTMNEHLLLLCMDMEREFLASVNMEPFFAQYKYESVTKIVSGIESLDKVCAFFGHLCQYLIQEIQEERGKHRRELAENACRYIQENYQRADLSAEEVAGYLELSAPYFSRLFRESMGKTYIEYLTNIRIAWAEELLRTTDRSVEEIGQEAGFSAASYFIARFKKIYGVSPSKYRQNCRQKEGEEDEGKM